MTERPARHRYRAALRWAATAGCLVVPACGPGPGGGGEPLEVTRVSPSLASPVVLNQEITVRFNRPFDPLTVTGDAVRVVDDGGHRVPGSLEISTQAVTFVPEAPLAPTLDDGSLRPGCGYVFEVAGFPRANAVRDVEGRMLAGTLRFPFRTVPADAGLVLWPTRASEVGFALDAASLAIAADSQQLRLYFHECPLPTTVTPAAFRLYRSAPGHPGGFETFAPAGAHLRRTGWPPGPRVPGWVVELELDRFPAEGASGYLGLELVADEGLVLRNTSPEAGGVPPRLVEFDEDGAATLTDVVGNKLFVRIYPGERVPLLDLDFGEEVAFWNALPGSGAVRFEVVDGEAVPLVREDAGTGRLGVFAPRSDVELVPGRPFDRGDGVLVQAEGPVFDFQEIHIPAGVEVRLHGEPHQPLQLRVCGTTRIEGALTLVDTPQGDPATWTTSVATTLSAASAVAGAAGVAIIAGGDIVVTVSGRITRVGAGRGEGSRSALTLLSGGYMFLWGRIPDRTVLATEPGRRVHGDVPGSPRLVTVAPMRRRLPDGVELLAAAETDWWPLPAWSGSAVEVRALGCSPGLDVDVQFAPADAVNPARPDDAPGVVSAPVRVPFAQPVPAPTGGFVRFILRAPVRAGSPLPALGGLVVLGDG